MGVKGKPQGITKGFTPEEVKIIREKLKQQDNIFETALFYVAIDSMLRCGDLVRLKVRDVMDISTGIIKPSFFVQPQKTKKRQRKPQPIFLSENTQSFVQQLIESTEKHIDDYLYHGRWQDKHMCTRTFRELVKKWAKMAGIQNVSAYSGHTTRRTLFNHFQRDLYYDLRVLKEFLSHSSIRSTEHYSNSVADQLEQIFRKHNLTS